MTLDDKIGYDASDHGTPLGKTEPTRESKFSWFEVFYHNGKIIACVYAGQNGDFCFCEEVEESKLSSYVEDDISIVLERLQSAKNKTK